MKTMHLPYDGPSGVVLTAKLAGCCESRLMQHGGIQTKAASNVYYGHQTG